MTGCRAAWVVPVVGPPIADGAVVWDDEAIVDVGPARDVWARWGPRVGWAPLGEAGPGLFDLGARAVLPGLINAHTHLELSWMQGLVAPAPSMCAWVRRLLAERAAGHRPTGSEPEDEGGTRVDRAIERAVAELVASGTVAVGDIANTDAAWDVLARSPLADGSVAFRELLGFRSPVPSWWPPPLRGEWLDRVIFRRVVARAARRGSAAGAPRGLRAGLAAHAPYSVAPALFAEVGRAAAAQSPGRASVHLAESAEELQLLADGTGPWRTLLEDLGVWTGDWRPPACGPVEYLERVGFAHRGMVCVHGTQLGAADLERLARWDATLVTCPRSNVWVGAGAPPVDAFFGSGVTVAVGTDSLASNADLNLFSELAALHRLAPDVPPRRLIEAATLGGARALGVERRLGAIAAGARPALVGVDMPPGVADVEAQLVSGIEPSRVHWVHDLTGR